MEDSVRELIINSNHEYHNEKYEQIDNMYRLMKELYNSIFTVNTKIMQTMDEIEKIRKTFKT